MAFEWVDHLVGNLVVSKSQLHAAVLQLTLDSKTVDSNVAFDFNILFIPMVEKEIHFH